MAKLKIIQYPNPILTIPGENVKIFDSELKKTIHDMFDTHYDADNCAALAATQLGIMLNISVIDFSSNKDQPLCIINPQIIHQEGETILEEGCMSITDVYAKVKRAEKITIRYQDISGKEHELKADGFLAKCIQHEIDHLNGILFISRLNPLKKALISKKLGRKK